MPKTKSPFLALSPEEAAEQALTPVIEWAKKYGRMTAIAEALTEATGASVSRQMVGRWLNPEPEKRMQPNLGMGMMLLHVVNVLRAAADPHRAHLGGWGVYVDFHPKPKTKTRNRNSK